MTPITLPRVNASGAWRAAEAPGQDAAADQTIRLIDAFIRKAAAITSFGSAPVQASTSAEGIDSWPAEERALYGQFMADRADQLQAEAAIKRGAAEFAKEMGGDESQISLVSEEAKKLDAEASKCEQFALASAEQLEKMALVHRTNAQGLQEAYVQLLSQIPPGSLGTKSSPKPPSPEVLQAFTQLAELRKQISQAEEQADTLERKAIEIRYDVADREPLHVATYNTYNNVTPDEVDSLMKDFDIFGLQEVDSGGEAGDIEEVTSDTHGVYRGEESVEHRFQRPNPWGREKTSSVAPIFYDKERFEPVHGESVELHGENFDGQGGSDRHANFLVLKDRTDGSVILVANTHWSNTSDAAQAQSRDVMNQKIAEIKAEYPIDGVIVLGDFNDFYPNLDGLSGDIPVREEGADGHRFIDHILVDGETRQYDTIQRNGGASDHDIISTELYLPEDSEPS